MFDDFPCNQDYLFVESFAGTAEATRQVQSSFPSRTTVALDIKFTPTMDLGTESGMGNPGESSRSFRIVSDGGYLNLKNEAIIRHR